MQVFPVKVQCLLEDYVFAPVGVMVPLKSSLSHFSTSTTILLLIGPLPQFSNAGPYPISSFCSPTSLMPQRQWMTLIWIAPFFLILSNPVGLKMFEYFSFVLCSSVLFSS